MMTDNRAVSPVEFASMLSMGLLVLTGLAFIFELDSTENLGFVVLFIIAFLQVVIIDAI